MGRQSARGVVLAIALAASAGFPVASQTLQPPAEEFYLQTTQEDSNHVFGLIDSKNTANASTGFVQLNGLNDPNDPHTVGSPKSQWWKDILLLTGDTDSVKLKNDATGLCIGDSIGGSYVATMRSCDDGQTIWHRTPQGNGIVYRRPYDVGNVAGINAVFYVCLGTDPNYPGVVITSACTLNNSQSYPDYVVWSRTTVPIATVSGGLTPAPPPQVPPSKPTACKLVGAAVCGQVQFSCDPLSASDTIVVPSGMIGVTVRSVQANIGLITATYLNSGQAPVSICATKPGLSACSSTLAVSFGSTTCPPPPPGQICPTGQEICKGVCSPFGTCMIR
jgi:hypothetical protein